MGAAADGRSDADDWDGPPGPPGPYGPDTVAAGCAGALRSSAVACRGRGGGPSGAGEVEATEEGDGVDMGGSCGGGGGESWSLGTQHRPSSPAAPAPRGLPTASRTGESEPGKSGAEEAGRRKRARRKRARKERGGGSGRTGKTGDCSVRQPPGGEQPWGESDPVRGRAGPGRGGPWTGRALPLPGAPRALPGPLRSVLDAAEEALLHHRHHQLAALVEQLSAGQAAGAHRDWGLLLVQQPVVRAERAVEPHRVVQ